MAGITAQLSSIAQNPLNTTYNLTAGTITTAGIIQLVKGVANVGASVQHGLQFAAEAFSGMGPVAKVGNFVVAWIPKNNPVSSLMAKASDFFIEKNVRPLANLKSGAIQLIAGVAILGMAQGIRAIRAKITNNNKLKKLPQAYLTALKVFGLSMPSKGNVMALGEESFAALCSLPRQALSALAQ